MSVASQLNVQVVSARGGGRAADLQRGGEHLDQPAPLVNVLLCVVCRSLPASCYYLQVVVKAATTCAGASQREGASPHNCPTAARGNVIIYRIQIMAQ